MAEIPAVELSGSPFERGKRHGREFATEIRENKEFYLDYFDTRGIENARDYADDVIDEFTDQHGEFIEEMEGVAEGAGLSLTDVGLINFRHTIFYSADEAPENEGCTSFGIGPEATDGAHTYVGQNWDWKLGVNELVMTVRQRSKSDFVALTEAGLVGGKMGMNEAGIGFAVNGLNTPVDGADPTRIPSHIRSRQILDAKRLDQAVEAIVGSPRPTSRNYLLGQATGEIINIETTPTDSFYSHPRDGILTHTNHFVTAESVTSTLERRVPHSITRRARATRLFETCERLVTKADIKRVLQDHVGKPKSICRHQTDGAPTDSGTRASLVFDLSAGVAYIANGPPCEHAYAEYHL